MMHRFLRFKSVHTPLLTSATSVRCMTLPSCIYHRHHASSQRRTYQRSSSATSATSSTSTSSPTPPGRRRHRPSSGEARPRSSPGIARQQPLQTTPQQQQKQQQRQRQPSSPSSSPSKHLNRIETKEVETHKDGSHVDSQVDTLAAHLAHLCEQHEYFRSDAMRRMVISRQTTTTTTTTTGADACMFRRFVEMMFGVGHDTEGSAFLMGRSVTDMCIADYLYNHFPNLRHDQLVATLLHFTKPAHLNTVACESLHMHTFLQRSSEMLSIEKYEFDSFLQTTLYRMVGAIFLEHGLFDAREFVVEHIVQRSVDISPFLESFDPMTELQDLLGSGAMGQHDGKHITFTCTPMGEHGPFQIQILAGTDLLGEAVAQTVKLGEMKSAQDALNRYYAEYRNGLTPLQREMAGMRMEQHDEYNSRSSDAG